MTWQQIYDPFGSMAISTALAAVPVVVMLVGLGFLHLKAHVAAGLGLLAALAIAVLGYGMPAGMAGKAALLGGFTGLLPIGWIVLNIIFLHRLADTTARARSRKTRSPTSRRTGACSCCSSRSRTAPSSRARPDSARRWR
jgi:lactate permease